MSETINFDGDPHIGVYCRVFEDLAVVPPQAPDNFVDMLRESLDVEILVTSIQGCSIIGSLLMGNSRGFVVSGLATPDEVESLSDYRDVMLLRGSMNAAGNVILANDYFCVVHPNMTESAADDIASFLGVPIIPLTLGGMPTVGMAAVATNNGVLVHPRVTAHEIERLEAIADLPIGSGSVNMGGGLVGTGLVANSKGYCAGMYTSGYELGRIEEVFGFLE